MAAWQVTQLKYALGLSTLFSFYGVVSYIVWMYGGKYGYDMTYRVTIIALILLTLPFTLIIGFVATRRQKKAERKKEEEAKAKAGEKQAEAQPQKAAAPTGAYDDLSKSAEETVQFLKSSNLGESGKDAVYSLPWYLVIGAPKSGKSSLVLGSQLNFQTLPSQRQSEQKFIRPTRSVDWRVTNDAVFLDTAGRYQTEGADQDEWSGLIETIKKYRANRPIDGLLLVVSAERILHADEREVEETAKVLRARLDDARLRLKVKFPVYLIFTHADAIEGFRDSFSTSKQEGKTLVWGATIPLEKTDNSQALFDGEYEILHNSVMQRRLMRLSAPFPPVRQLRIFNFPLHFGAARRKLGSFVTTLFRPNPFSESPFLRGFYFTAVPVNRPKIDGNQTMTNLPQTVGQTFFTEKFFRDVLLRDKDLVRTFQEQQQKPPILGWLLTALGTVLVTLLLGLAAVSLYYNKKLIDEAGEKGEAVLSIYKADANSKISPLDKDPGKTKEEIKALDELREVLVKLDEYKRDGAPWYMGFGLYSGDKIYLEKLLPIVYVNAVEQRFKEPVVRKLEDDLRKFASSQLTGNPEQQDAVQEANFNLLTAYLMLSAEHKKRAESTTLVNALEGYWKTESKLPPELSEVAKENLIFYARQVDREQFPPIRVDTELVEKVRQKLRNYPAVNRYYKRKVTEISKAIEDKNGALTTEKILATGGGDTNYIEGTYTVPGAFTLEGNQLMKTAISEASAKLSEDDWVMGEQGKGSTAQSNDIATLESRYYRDYADHWRNFVKGLNVRPYDKQNADEALLAFSSANSPIEILLKEISRQTNLSAEPKQGWIDWLFSFFRRTKPKNTGGNTQVEKEFRPLFDFIGEEGKQNTPAEKYRGYIGSVANKYGGFSPNDIEQVSQDLAKGDKTKFPQLSKAEADIRSTVGAFNQTPSGQEIGAFLQEPLGNLQTLLGVGGKELLARNWSEKLLPKAKNLEKGYPFEAVEAEADLKNLRTFLNPVSGELSTFYNESLKIYFETVDGKLKPKESSDVNFSDEFVAYLNNAFRLQRALYGEKGSTEKFEYDFKLNPVRDAIIEVIIDGQPIKSEETASAKLTFPASAGQTGVLMKFASTGGTTSTSGSVLATNSSTNSSANTPSSTVNSARNSTQNNQTDSSGEMKWQGSWGLFKFFDNGSPEKQPSGGYLLKYNFGGKTVTAIITPSGEDLFDKNLFRSVRAPEKLFK